MRRCTDRRAAFFSELFGANVRYSGGVARLPAFVGCWAGGLAPIIAAGLLRLSHDRPWSVAAYLVACTLVTLISVYLARRGRRDRRLRS